MYSENILTIGTAQPAKNKKRFSYFSAFLSIGLFLATGGTVEAQNYMVCQTPAFWCAIPGKAPNGYPCYCNSPFGPVGGIAIDPTPYVPSPDPDVAEEEVDLDEDTQDCLNGLGECKGKFKSAVKKKKQKKK